MPIYKTILLRKEEVADGTMAFHFEKPKGFVFKAGQFADFTLIKPIETDDEGNTRSFSLASAPYEDTLMFATRMRDTAFKRTLRMMEAGAEVSLDGPHGSFVLHKNSSIPAVFLTGGIGVTPVRSIVLQAAHDNLPHRMFVFYSNRSPDDATFLNTLIGAETRNPNYALIATMTEKGISWNGETGHITKTMLEKHIDDLTLPIYYLVGPASMVTAMRNTLNEAGVDDDSIRTEEFSGY
jgi:ferredoxin-NADP reductase